MGAAIFFHPLVLALMAYALLSYAAQRTGGDETAPVDPTQPAPLRPSGNAETGRASFAMLFGLALGVCIVQYVIASYAGNSINFFGGLLIGAALCGVTFALAVRTPPVLAAALAVAFSLYLAAFSLAVPAVVEFTAKKILEVNPPPKDKLDVSVPKE